MLSVAKIWDAAPHNAFTDLIRFRERWFCTFREGQSHASPGGVVRVIVSDDGKTWSSAAALTEPGVDLRDPKFSLTPAGRLMMVMGGSILEAGNYVGRQPRVSFSDDGRVWESPRRILASGDWLWRVTWLNGRAYGVSYQGGGGLRGVKRSASLYESADGVAWRLVTPLDLPGASETTLRFLPSGEMIALSVDMRTQPRSTRIGSSLPPYRDWSWRDVPYALGGPNFLLLPDGRWIASTRNYAAEGSSHTVMAWMNRDSIRPFLTLPSGGDTSYAGLVRQDDALWVSYYSSHEGKSAIYLARIRVPAP
ncbi:MAG: hypothetical protein RIQ93_253 [Verrucomicrobiota bacterium]